MTTWHDSFPGRCLGFCEIEPGGQMKRCVRAHGHPESEGCLWVEATADGGTALVVRWHLHSRTPYETLIARQETP